MKPYSTVVAEDLDALVQELDAVLAPLAGTTILVTGAAGFLMSYIVDVVARWNAVSPGRECRVLALDNYQTGVPERLEHLAASPAVRIIRHDISQPLELDEAVDWIVHGASIASPTVYRQFPLETIDANVNGTRHLLNLARSKSATGMLLMSTSEIYGDPAVDAIPTPESYRGFVSCTGPRACYDESKRMAETLATTYFRLYGTPIKIIRPFNVYGPGLRLDDKRVLPDFMTQVLEDGAIELLSDGTPTRAFCYVSDAVSLMFRILVSDAAGVAFNVGNDEQEVSMLALADTTAMVGAKVLGRAPIRVTRQVSEDPDYLVDNPQRRCADLRFVRSIIPEWTLRVSLEAGLERTFRHHIERQSVRVGN